MKNAMTRIAGIVALTVLSLGFAAQANAQATRTWISGEGDDVNPCSRTAPCKTFAGAISKTAASGEIDCLDPGGFGAVTITKSITLDCGGMAGGILSSSGANGITVNAGTGDRIFLRNLTLIGTATGAIAVRFVAGASLTLDNVAISGFGAASNAAVDFRPSTAGAKLYMRDVQVLNNLGVGINIAPTSGAVVSAQLENVFVVGNGASGLQVLDGAVVSVSNSRFAGNASKGIFVRSVTTPAEANLDGVLSVNNAGQGLTSQGAGATIRMSDTSIYGNSLGIQSNLGGAIISFINNRVSGNVTDGAPTTTQLMQ